MRLLKVWGHVLQVHVRGTQPPPARDCFVLVDDRRVPKRFDRHSTGGIMRLDSRADMVDLGIRFDSKWNRAKKVSAHTLGL